MLTIKCDPVRDYHLLTFVDVDYYADMAKWLWTGRPALVYTFCPTSAGGVIPEGTFHIQDDELFVVYSGGARYNHKLWDYNVDHLVVKGRLFSLLVKVDQVVLPSDKQRRIVLLTPTTWYPSMYNGLLRTRNELRRRKFSYGPVNVLTYIDRTRDGEAAKTNLMVSVSLAGCPAHATVDYATFCAIMARFLHTKNPNIADIERMLRAKGVEDAASMAPIIYEAWNNGWCKRNNDEKQVGAGEARGKAPHFQHVGPLAWEDGEDIGVQVFDPIVTGAGIFPASSENNDTAAIVGRVENVRNTVNPGGKYRKYFNEFIRAFPIGVLEPYSMDYVIEKQNRPLQKIRCQKHKNLIGQAITVVRSFMKREAYGKITDPRNISTLPPSHTMELSAYTYAAKEEVFRTMPWFMPCKNPREISAAVMELAEKHKEILSTDYSRLDGTLSYFLRTVEHAVYKRLFNPKYRPRLLKLLDSEMTCPAFTDTGLKYQQKSSRLSGSPTTTDGNTLIVAFVLYCAARNARMIKPGEITNIPGLVYGDDTLCGGLRASVMERTARDLGLTLKCEVSKECQPVTFLSRVFVDPWTTSTSVQEPKRALGKMHLSVIRNIDKRLVARNKAKGYLATDKLTPLMSEYATHILEKTSMFTDDMMTKYDFTRDTNFWLYEYGENEAWPQTLCDLELMESVVAKHLDLTVDQLRTKCDEVKRGNWTPIHFDMEVPPNVIVRHEPRPEQQQSGRRRNRTQRSV